LRAAAAAALRGQQRGDDADGDRQRGAEHAGAQGLLRRNHARLTGGRCAIAAAGACAYIPAAPLPSRELIAMAQPVIGLTLDYEQPGGYSKLPWYALRENYCAAVTRAGGLPLLLPHDPDQVAAYLALLDGVVVTGGAFDVDPALFGATT